MGLDMYLYKETYVQQWDFQEPKDKYHVTVLKGGKVDTTIKPERVAYVIEQVGYWRKFNALHSWFVENVQGGVDNCQKSYVEEDTLKELLEILKIIDADHSQGPILLPTQSGFFFGTTDYADWYYQDVKETVALLESLLNEPGSGSYYYQASW